MTVPINHSELQLLQTSPFERVFASWQICRGESLRQSLIQCEYTWYQTDGSQGEVRRLVFARRRHKPPENGLRDLSGDLTVFGAFGCATLLAVTRLRSTFRPV